MFLDSLQLAICEILYDFSNCWVCRIW